MKTLIEQLTKERDDDFTSEKEIKNITKEIFRIQTRLNNYTYKYDMWLNEMVEDIKHGRKMTSWGNRFARGSSYVW